jgi:hypothetical protein
MRVSTNKRVGAAEVAECVTLAPRLWIAATVGGETVRMERGRNSQNATD